MLEDTFLILRFKAGHSSALRRIYLKYRLYLLKLAGALCHDVTEAEDIVHDVFVRFVQSGPKLKVKGSLKAYLRTCVVNAVRNRHRAAQVRSSVSLDQSDSQLTSETNVEHWVSLREEAMRIHEALIRIPWEQREVVVLHLHGDMTFREIAQVQSVSLKTVQSRYRYGLDKLRSSLDGEVRQ